MSAEFSGTLKERVRIEQRNPARDTIGGASGIYSYDSEAWASVMPLMPADVTQAGALSAMPRWQVTMRKREGISPATRLTWRGRFLAVRTITSDPREPARMVLACEELR